MTPFEAALTSAVVVALLSSAFLSVDRMTDQFLASWARRRYLRYRAAMGALHVVATAIVSLGSRSIGWVPDASTSGFEQIAHGIAWAITATALLRADFTGLQSSSAAPGFSLLRGFSDQLVKDVSRGAAENVQISLNNIKSADDLARTAFRSLESGLPPSVEGTGNSIVKDTLMIQIGSRYEEIRKGSNEVVINAQEGLRSLTRQLIVTYRVTKNSSGIE